MSKVFSKSDLGIYVWTSDKNIACLPTWAYLFNKFWPYKTSVRVLGYKKPNFDLPENFEFISLGKQRGVKYWSNDMFDYYKDCEHKYFYGIWEDAIIIDHVDSEILDLAIKISFLNKNDNFFKFNLSLDVQQRPHVTLKKFNDYDLILSSQSTIYRHSTNHYIWSRDKFLQKLIPDQSPWDFELDNNRAMNDGLDIYATKHRYAIRMGHGYKQGKKIHNWYEENSGYGKIKSGEGVSLSIEDINYIENNNWMPETL